MTRRSPSRRTVHIPVMLREVLAQLDLRDGLTVVDGTVGAGGHSQKILPMIGEAGRLIGIDRDREMLDRAAQVVAGPQVVLEQASYLQLQEVLAKRGLTDVDRILLDLGLSSDQLASPDRGFGFDTSGSLDMRFDVNTGQSVSELLASASENEIAEIIQEFGEDRQAGNIAKQIVSQRKSGQPIQNVDQLVDAVLAATGGHSGDRRSPSVVRVFQAMRIAVNEELKQLDHFLDSVLPHVLRPGGRIAIITFHSLEDRRVKQAFRQSELLKLVTPKPLAPTPSEVRMNPRARSAKLRVAERIER
ncbi:Ribosomal RNA small subunit methyltransferase H [Thalassoglobus neptunius]|uniref:Ribosomal RNA small subunit methyltransferase H n=1 Tax=Thalassoglobus neptunius TaxID=1938619 RepID=A0A5C5X5Y2_9PLAN|nr:16S rRNA (cytosine(1402)-N(4))-methyltransferase RsmH [Thalassoglobus neptunius]TWT57741.1 Ribosomal RNA small subunit methyltransferase H [Thalassoglobus neptunius]